MRTDCEYARERELQLLGCHRLKVHREVEWRNGDLSDLLEWIDEAFLDDLDRVDTKASDGQIGVWFGYMIPHCNGWSVVDGWS